MPGLLLHSQGELAPELVALVRLLDPTCNPEEARRQLQAPGALDAARAHGVTMLVYQRWAGQIAQTLAPETATDWAATCRTTALRTFRQRAAAGALLTALGEAGVEALPLRGLWLAEAVYSDPSLRPSQDVDIWVAPEQLAATAQVLRQCGMVPVEGVNSLSNREPVPGPPEARAVAGSWEPTNSDGLQWGLRVDVHAVLHVSSHGWWPFWPPYSWLRERSQPWDGMGPLTLQPTLPLALLVQCDNIVRHALARRPANDRLVGYYDAALIAQRMSDVDWEQAVADAHQARMALHLAAVLASLDYLWGVKSPAGIIAGLQRCAVSASLAAWALRRPRGLGHFARAALFQVCAMSTPAEAARYIVRNVVPGISHMLKPQGDASH